MSGNLIKVAVIMSTYNGEKYLKEQIDSILAQNDVDVKLFIRDDGSKDKTPDIINEYVEKYDNVVFWNKDNVVNLGVRDSFLTLLKEVCDKYTEINYFAFADQDNVDKPDKLSAAVKMIEDNNYESDFPTLYYSNKTFCDENLEFISEENIKYYGDFYETLWVNLASGCTMVMNRPLALLSISNMPKYEGFVSDSWVYRLAKVCGAKIVFDCHSYILYREHSNQLYGSKFQRLVKLENFTMFIKDRGRGFQQQIEEIARLKGDLIPEENKKYVEWVLNYDKKFSSKLHLILSKQMRQRGFYLYIVWIIKVLLNRI